MPRRHLRSAGFTLIELIMTMIVIGILAVVALPRMNLLSGFDEVGYRDKLRATLEFARKSAVAQRRNVRATLSAGTLTLTVASDTPEGSNANVFGRNLALPSIDKACAAPAAHTVCLPSGVTVSGPATLTFSPLGRPSGTTNCTPSGAAAGYCYTVTGQSSGTVTVEAETGYVH